MQEDIIPKIARWIAALFLTICAIFYGTFIFGILVWGIIHWNLIKTDINQIIYLLIPTVIIGFFAWRLWRATFSGYRWPFFSALIIIYFGTSLVPGMVTTLWKQNDTRSIALFEVFIILCIVGTMKYVKNSKSILIEPRKDS